MNIIKESLIKDCVCAGDKIAVAVSGGIDSMVLLHAFMIEAEQLDISYYVVNIEHGIRGEESIADSQFVKDFCNKYNIKFVGIDIDVPTFIEKNGMSEEEGARVLRYRAFDEQIKENECNKIALAHHMSDQAETVLMRIIRGTGIKGLRGMKKINGYYIRPLLDLEKNKIINMQQQYEIPYIVDKSNFDNNYTRNLLRNEIIPSLKKLSLNAERGLVRLTRIATEAENFIEKFDNPIIIEGKNVRLNIIDDEDKLLFKRRVRACFDAININKDIEERHLNLLYDFINCENGARLDMPYGAVAYREYDSILFTKEKSQNYNFTVPFVTGKVGFLSQVIKITKYNGEDLQQNELMFDITKIPSTAVFRTRRNGDVFSKFGRGGTKNLGDYLTDKKVPTRLRDNLILCAVDNEILFIAGIEISEKIRADLNKKNNNNIYKVTMEA